LLTDNAASVAEDKYETVKQTIDKS